MYFLADIRNRPFVIHTTLPYSGEKDGSDCMKICYTCGKKNENTGNVCTSCGRFLDGNSFTPGSDGTPNVGMPNTGTNVRTAAVTIGRRYGRTLPQGYFWTYLLPIVFCLVSGFLLLIGKGAGGEEGTAAVLHGIVSLMLAVAMLADMILALRRIRRADVLHRELRNEHAPHGDEEYATAIGGLIRVETGEANPIFAWMVLPIVYLCWRCSAYFLGIVSGGSGKSSAGRTVTFVFCLLAVAVLVFLAVCRTVQMTMIAKRRRSATAPHIPADVYARVAEQPAPPMPTAVREIRKQAPVSVRTEPVASKRKESENPMICRSHTAPAAPAGRLVPMFDPDAHRTTTEGKGAFAENIDPVAALTAACGALIAGAASRGFALADGSAREILSAMASSRLLIVSGTPDDTVLTAMEAALCHADGAYFGETLPEGWTALSDLMYRRERNGTVVPSDILRGLAAATAAPRTVCPISLIGMGDVHPESADALCLYAASPARFGRLSLGTPQDPALTDFLSSVPDVRPAADGQASMPMPANVWFWIRPAAGRILPAGLAGYTATVELNGHVSGNGTTGAPEKPLFPDMGALRRMTESARAVCFLPEEMWKSLDSLESYLVTRAGLHLDNRLIRRVETYTSVYMSCGGQPEDAMDSALASLILPLLSIFPASDFLAAEGQMGIADCLDRLFGHDRLPRSFRTLERLGLGGL